MCRWLCNWANDLIKGFNGRCDNVKSTHICSCSPLANRGISSGWYKKDALSRSITPYIFRPFIYMQWDPYTTPLIVLVNLMQRFIECIPRTGSNDLMQWKVLMSTVNSIRILLVIVDVRVSNGLCLIYWKRKGAANSNFLRDQRWLLELGPIRLPSHLYPPQLLLIFLTCFVHPSFQGNFIRAVQYGELVHWHHSRAKNYRAYDAATSSSR